MKIAILGFDVEGKSTYRYLKNLNPKYEIDAYDQRVVEDADIKVTTVESFLDIDYVKYGVIVRTASLIKSEIYDKIVADKGGRHDFNFTSNTQIFFDKCPAPIIGVTGTKGKGTVSSLIAEILRVAGRKVHLVGNIGVPALDILPEVKPDDVVVYELSSFQLWEFKRRSPHVAVMTMIEPDHLDVHENFSEYTLAKSNIFKYQMSDDVAVYNDDDALVCEMGESSRAQHRPFPNNKFAHVKQSKIYYSNIEIAFTDIVKLPGEHNVRNVLAAINAVWDIAKGDIDAIKTGISKFTGLSHRLKLVRTVDDVQFYDDSIATTPGSTAVAIKSFDAPKVLIIGGQDKGANYDALGREIAKYNIRTVFAIGANRAKVAAAIRTNSDAIVHELDTKKMPEIVAAAYRAAESGDIVILSPAAASFDMFKNYQDRGEQFVAAVNSL